MAGPPATVSRAAAGECRDGANGVALAGIELDQASWRADDALVGGGGDFRLAAQDRDPRSSVDLVVLKALAAGMARAIARASFVEERTCGACGLSSRSLTFQLFIRPFDSR